MTQIQINVFNNALLKMERLIFMEIQSQLYLFVLYQAIVLMELMEINMLGYVFLIALIINGNIKKFVLHIALMVIMVIL